MEERKFLLRKRIKGWKIGDILNGYVYLLPSLILLLVFTVYPVLSSFRLSFTKWEILRPPQSVGLTNYIKLFTDEKFWDVLGNTVYYTIGTVPLCIIVSLVMAIILNQKLLGVKVFRAVYFLPVISTWVAVAVVWRWMFNYEFGIINYFTGFLNIPPVDWLGSTFWAMPSIILVSVWKTAGYNMVIFLAGLQGIPQVLYEAAEIDGATKWSKVRYITIPLLTPSILFVLVISMIRTFQVFGPVYVMTDGGPVGETDVLIFYLFENAFRFFKMGYASAIAWILFIIIFVLTIVQLASSKRWVHYG